MTNDEMAMEMANYLLIGKPIPEDLIDNLMASVCEEVKQERERDTANNSKNTVA